MSCENCDRLRAERNRLVETTELGALSERLEEDNAATDATMVRSAMHKIDRLERAMLAFVLAHQGADGDLSAADVDHYAMQMRVLLRDAGVLS